MKLATIVFYKNKNVIIILALVTSMITSTMSKIFIKSEDAKLSCLEK